ncbi:MAG: sodium:alanine symporter family protein [Candidatus Omnitrophica bacterium]|nr:sodium:alanine symporter family protein [Candidatus Omnitrophota bacterium]
MTDFFASFSDILNLIDSYVWGMPLIVILLGTGVLLTIRLAFLQFTHLPRALKLAFSKSDETAEGDISHFKALMTALAATIGTGNIAGVAIAIASGGPGAVFWMWITALLGMSLKYGEALLAVKYRVKDAKGEMLGGPMYALERGLGIKWLGILFAIFGSIAAFGIGNMVQANSVADALNETFTLPTWAAGLIMASLTAAVILGGIQRIGSVTGFLVPFMAIIYAIGALVILALHIDRIPSALSLIVTHAFSPTAAAGGFAGSVVRETIRWGISKGLFSNEAGLGSAPIAAAAAKTSNPMRQALVSMTGTFIDTIIVCSMTALVILCTGVWTHVGEDGAALTGAPLTVTAFRVGLPGIWGGMIVSCGILLFAYSTILGWCYYGEKCIEYLFGLAAVLPYRIVWVLFILLGATRKLDTVWAFSDIMNALMALPNLIALIFLSGVIVKETRSLDKETKPPL